ncbi:MAG: energy transducer TonB [Betaproteobacteria bacterium]|nr:energy transducer TonB [Betaproteobacteria bacterium]
MNSPGFAAPLSLTRNALPSLQGGRLNFAFAVALLLSLLFHALAPASILFFLHSEKMAQKNMPSAIHARLEIAPPPVEPVKPPETAPPEGELAQNLRLKKLKQPPPAPVPPPPQPLPDKPLARLAAAASRQLAAMEQAGNLYPLEAIAQQQEGEVWVRIFFDEAGEVIAARLEESSGYPLLDNAALRAVRSLQSLPADDMESVILPVRFRLRKMR